MPGRYVHGTAVALVLMSSFALTTAGAAITVKEGETLFAVARKAQVPLDVLSAFNGISDTAKVKAGAVIRVPTAYVVKKGDTLYGIAREFGVPVAKLLELNKLPQGAMIKAGDKLYVPVEVGAAGGAPVLPTAQQAPEKGSAAPAPSKGAPALIRPTIVWPHEGRHEPFLGRPSGLVIFGAEGDVVRSATDGEVKYAAVYWGRGKVVIIKSTDGSIISYGGNRELLVNVGDRVSAGAEIARLGETPQGGSVKLYLTIQDKKGQIIDPEKYISAKSQT